MGSCISLLQLKLKYKNEINEMNKVSCFESLSAAYALAAHNMKVTHEQLYEHFDNHPVPEFKVGDVILVMLSASDFITLM